MALNDYFDVISDMTCRGKTYMEISAQLQNLGVAVGSSEANIRKFCRAAGINHRSGTLTKIELETAVEAAITEARLYILYKTKFGCIMNYEFTNG